MLIYMAMNANMPTQSLSHPIKRNTDPDGKCLHLDKTQTNLSKTITVLLALTDTY